MKDEFNCHAKLSTLLCSIYFLDNYWGEVDESVTSYSYQLGRKRALDYPENFSRRETFSEEVMRILVDH